MSASLAASLLAATVMAGATPQVVSSFGDAAAARAGVTADLLTGAQGAGVAALIDAAAAQEQVKESTRKTVPGRQKTYPISSRGYVVGIGGAVYFYYRDPAPSGAAPQACRVRATSNIRSPERLKAVRWCYEKLGGAVAR